MDKSTVLKKVNELKEKELLTVVDNVLAIHPSVVERTTVAVVERTTTSTNGAILSGGVVERTTKITTNDEFIYINNNINNINNTKNNTTTNLSALVKREQDLKTEKAAGHEFLKGSTSAELWPGSPCSFEQVESYFKKRFDLLGLDNDSGFQAYKFMEHHGTKNGWHYLPRGRNVKYKKAITPKSWIRHAVTWVENVKKGLFQDERVPAPQANGATNEHSFHMTYQEVLQHSQLNGFAREGSRWMELHYETNGKSGPQIRWRFKGDESLLKKKSYGGRRYANR